jgi:ABC-2 type transport system ATP-binding protein
MRDMRADPAACDQGIIVLLSSHLMAEVEELCDRVAIIGPGRLLYEGALDELIASTPAAASCAPPTTSTRWRSLRATAKSLRSQAGSASAATKRAVAELSVALGLPASGITALVPRTAKLEELFFRMTEGPSINGHAKLAGAAR